MTQTKEDFLDLQWRHQALKNRFNLAASRSLKVAETDIVMPHTSGRRYTVIRPYDDDSLVRLWVSWLELVDRRESGDFAVAVKLAISVTAKFDHQIDHSTDAKGIIVYERFVAKTLSEYRQCFDLGWPQQGVTWIVEVSQYIDPTQEEAKTADAFRASPHCPFHIEVSQ